MDSFHYQIDTFVNPLRSSMRNVSNAVKALPDSLAEGMTKVSDNMGRMSERLGQDIKQSIFKVLHSDTALMYFASLLLFFCLILNVFSFLHSLCCNYNRFQFNTIPLCLSKILALDRLYYQPLLHLFQTCVTWSNLPGWQWNVLEKRLYMWIISKCLTPLFQHNSDETVNPTSNHPVSSFHFNRCLHSSPSQTSTLNTVESPLS